MSHTAISHQARVTDQTGYRRPIGRILIAGLGALALVIGITPMTNPPVTALPTTVPADQFSADRALEDLKVIAAHPRVVGTDGIATAQTYLMDQLRAMGLEPQLMDEVMVHSNASREYGMMTAARSHVVVARIPGTDSTGAVLVAGHLDTVHTTTGAGDCGVCSVVALEAVRAIISGKPLRNDVILVFEDGEEMTRAGALAFVTRHPWAKTVRVAINGESMGSGGPAYLYVTGPQNGWIIPEALRAMPSPVAYSFINDLIWLTGTGGSDLDQWLMAAPVGLGFVFTNDVPSYHTMRNSVDRVDPDTIQHQGENTLALIRHFGDIPLDGELRQPDQVYLTLFGTTTLNYPGALAGPLAVALAVAALGLIAVGWRRGRLSLKSTLIGLPIWLLLAIISIALVSGLWSLTRTVDPQLQVFLIGISYDEPAYCAALMLLNVALMLAGYGLLRHKMAVENLAAGGLLAWIVFALLTGFMLPGSSALFLIPAACALVPLALYAWPRGSDTDSLAQMAGWGLSFTAALLIIAPAIEMMIIFAGRAEILLNLPTIAIMPGFFSALLAGLLLNEMDFIAGGRRWALPLVFGAGGALLFVGVTLTAHFSPDRPKPNMIAYVDDQNQNQAFWVSVAGQVNDSRASLIDEWTAQFLGEKPQETRQSPWGSSFIGTGNPAYRAPAPWVDLPGPQVTVLKDEIDHVGNRQLALHIVSPANAPTEFVWLGAPTGILRVELPTDTRERLLYATPHKNVMLVAYGLAGEGYDLQITLSDAGPLSLDFEDEIYSLPDVPGFDIPQRPDWMMPSPTFVSDSTLIRKQIVIK